MPANDQTIAPDTRDQWAAYILGRHPVFIGTWLEETYIQASKAISLRERFSKTHRTWENGYCSVANAVTGKLEEFNRALRDLAVAKRVDPAILIELHHSWDKVDVACSRIVEAAQDDNFSDVMELCNPCEIHLADSSYLVEKLLLPTGTGGELNGWRTLGHNIARIIDNLKQGYMYKSYFPSQCKFSSQLNQFSPSLLNELNSLQRSATEMFGLENLDNDVSIEDEDRRKHETLAEATASFDANLRNFLYCLNPTEPVVIVDESRQVLTIYGCEISFKKFMQSNASSGLKCFIALARHPEKDFHDDELLKAAGLNCDLGQLEPYFSRFRKVVREAYESQQHHQLPPEANMLFVERVSTKVPKGATYWLTLEPRLVRYIGKMG